MNKCGLCRKENELKKSHLIPKSLYKIVRNSYPDSGREIVQGFWGTKSINYSDKQLSLSFLCGECEEKFNKNGENCVIAECYREKKRFDLFDKISAGQSLGISGGEEWIIPDESVIEINSYKYFALSILWRSSEGKWPIKFGLKRKSLGNEYEKAIRSYLLGENDFPENIYISIYVDNDSNKYPTVAFPTVEKKSGYHIHTFIIPGVTFRVIIGRKVPEIRKVFSQNPHKVFFIKHSFKNSIEFRQIYSDLRSKIKPRGRLLDEYKKSNKTSKD